MSADRPRALEGAALPPGLRDLRHPPARVFVHGDVPRGPCVAVVGTRTPSPEAAAYARQFACRLAERGVAIVSGGAEGIDAAAHQGALDAGGVTLVVAPSSFEHPYPEQHAKLFAQIVASGGGYLSAYAEGVAPRRGQFFYRNSLLVALSHVLVVVEAPLRSGARNAARWARRLQRPYFVVPAVPWNPLGLGCIAELRLGGRPLSGPEQILRWLAERQLHPLALPPRQPASDAVLEPDTMDQLAAPHAKAASGVAPRRRGRSRQSRAQPTSPLEAAILNAVRAGARFPDEIALAAGLSAAEVSHGLLLLTLNGSIIQPDGAAVTIVG